MARINSYSKVEKKRFHAKIESQLEEMRAERRARNAKEITSVVSVPRSPKVRWKSEKPLQFLCKTYKVDVNDLAHGVMTVIEEPKQVLSSPAKEKLIVKSDCQASAHAEIVMQEQVRQEKQTKTLLELAVSEKLAKALNGQREAANPAGRVDVLTSEHVIEVKEACNWKHGIGQALIYSFYYPGRKPMLYLFGENLEVFQEIAKQHCDRLGIEYRDSLIA